MEMNKNIEKWYELHTDEVNALSDDIWAHPEVGMQEHYAAKATAAFMRKYGFEVQELDWTPCPAWGRKLFPILPPSLAPAMAAATT